MRTRVAATGGFGLLLILMLMVPLPQSGRALRAFSDLLHAPAFAVLAALAASALSRCVSRSKTAAALGAWLLVAAFGCLTEAAQGLVGRYPSWHDMLANALGAGAGTLWVVSRLTRLRGSRIVLLLAAVLLFSAAAASPALVLADGCLQRLEMPQLASFEYPLELSRWTWRECRVQRVESHATDGSWALQVDLQPGIYPGVALGCPPPDWSRYDELVFDVCLEDGPPLDLVVKIEDAEHNGEPYDRFHQREHLIPGRREVHVLLSEVVRAPRGRQMDLHRISFLQLFTVRLDSPRTLHLDNFRLR